MDSIDVLAVLRDIAIIVLAVFQIIAAAAIIVLAFLMWRLIKLVQAKVGDLSQGSVAVLDQARDAASSAAEGARTAKGSVSFISDTVVAPVITVAAVAAGAKKFVDALFRADGGR